MTFFEHQRHRGDRIGDQRAKDRDECGPTRVAS
jgi:hypothetical protein